MLRIKIKLTIFLSSLLILTSCVFGASVQAALITVGNDGSVRVNVLGDQDIALSISEPARLEIKKVASAAAENQDATINLASADGKISLTVSSGGATKELDITDLSQDIVEIEKTSTPQTIKILAKNDMFVIQERGVNAVTSYPISINAVKKELSVKSATGERYVSVLPYEALENTVKANTINVIPGQITLGENENGDLSYTISGERKVVLTRLINFTVPVSAQVSATNGQILTVDQPLWFSVIDFLFV